MTRKEIVAALIQVEAKLLADKDLSELAHVRELRQVLGQLETLDETMAADFPLKLTQADRDDIARAVEAKLPPSP